MLKEATLIMEELEETLNNEDVCFADCIVKVLETADKLRQVMVYDELYHK